MEQLTESFGYSSFIKLASLYTSSTYPYTSGKEGVRGVGRHFHRSNRNAGHLLVTSIDQKGPLTDSRIVRN